MSKQVLIEALGSFMHAHSYTYGIMSGLTGRLVRLDVKHESIVGIALTVSSAGEQARRLCDA